MFYFHHCYFYIQYNCYINCHLIIIKKINKDYEKKPVKDIKIFLEKKKKKSDSMVVNVTKIFQEMKNKSLSSIEKDITEWEKGLYYGYKKVFSFRKLAPLWEKLFSFVLIFEKFSLSKQRVWNFWLSCFASSLLKYKKVFSQGVRKFHFLKYNKHFQSGVFFSFFEPGNLLPEIYKKFLRVSISWNIRKFYFLKYKEFWGFRFLEI